MNVSTAEATATLEVRDLVVRYPVRQHWRRGWFTAVDDFSLSLRRTGVAAVVGESGSGKSSAARGIVGLARHVAGSVRVHGTETLHGAAPAASRAVQMVFQDPYSSLNPARTVGYSIAEAVRFHQRVDKTEAATRTAALLRSVGLDEDMAVRFPREFSGGQRQRVAIARAIAPRPDVLICDEAVSALDVSTQRQILDLIEQLRMEQDLSVIFITHDLAVARIISHETKVMYRGRIVEQGPTEAIFEDPVHPYTKALIASIPHARRRQRRERAPLSVVSDTPDAVAAPDATGCSFAIRCPEAHDTCRIAPDPVRTSDGRAVACHLAGP